MGVIEEYVRNRCVSVREEHLGGTVCVGVSEKYLGGSRCVWV